jgi:hypothetical protein
MSIITDEQPAENFAPLLSLIRLAKSRQRGTITLRQYIRLERKYVSSRPKRRAGLLVCWVYEHSRQLRSELAAQGVTVRPEKPGRFHPFKLVERGFARLSEIERKMKRARRRRRS